MFPFEPTFLTATLVLFPSIAVFLLWWMTNRAKTRRKEGFFLISFLCGINFYIFAPDPSVAQKLYVETGDLLPIYVNTAIAFFFLLLMVFAFKQYMSHAK